jgi:chromosome segregation ATPase
MQLGEKFNMSIQPTSLHTQCQNIVHDLEALVEKMKEQGEKTSQNAEKTRKQLEKSREDTAELRAVCRAQSREYQAQSRETEQLRASIHAQFENSANKTEQTQKDTYVSLQDPSNETDTLGTTTDELLARARAQKERTDKLLPSIDNPPSVSSHDQREKVTPHNDETSADSSAIVKKEPFLTRLFHAIYAWFKSMFPTLEI